MAFYVIGDVQGCFDEFIELLTVISFNPSCDQLWLTGDLVNRGPKSLAVLREVKNLGDRCVTVLGNHDLHLLAVVSGISPVKSNDTFHDILQTPDCNELCDWLRQQKLLHYDPQLDCLLVHAGIAPLWNLQQSMSYAHEIEIALRAESYSDFLRHMYGDHPNYWDERFTGFDRLRVICNYLTRVRFCDADGKLDLHVKGGFYQKNDNLKPWYRLLRNIPKTTTIVFGHWAALNGVTHDLRAICIDTGCVWGNQLSAFRLDDHKWFHVKSQYTFRG